MLTSRWLLNLKALRQLGLAPVGLYALYQLGLQSGHYQRQLDASLAKQASLNSRENLTLHPCLPTLPARETLLELYGSQAQILYDQADEIVNGQVRLFGGQPVPLVLTQPEPLDDWARYEQGDSWIGGQDIKFVWEPARFGWACTLAMAYHLSKYERYAKAFWHHTELFLTSNPPYLGPQWSSAQEVAIRLIALAFSAQVFTQSRLSTAERLEMLAKAFAAHADRIPPTMVYARSQNNNHLILEALGLYTASALLPEHPLAPKWHHLGWKWLRYAFRSQIDPDGTYTQHSTNYHRLMLQAALWMVAVHDQSFASEPIPQQVQDRLGATTRWLWKLVDIDTGCVPNLGHNDGAYTLPLTVCPYHDYRPVIHAAAKSFLNTNLEPHGSWDDMRFWLCHPSDATTKETRFDIWRETLHSDELNSQPPHIIQNHRNASWATFRVAAYHTRPAHADQLHLDLWWHGLNLAQDPGTYLYNSPPPWENSLTIALVHNTVVVDDQEFMLRAGRFLYLDWAQAKVITAQTTAHGGFESITAQHNGYRKVGVIHTREVTTYDDGHWEIVDKLNGNPGSIHTAHLHWLLPDWEYEFQESPENASPGYTIQISSPFGRVSLKVGLILPAENDSPTQNVNIQVARAGTLLYGTGAISPIFGWTSPTYADKIPALACILEVSQSLPIELRSEWVFPDES